MTLPANLLRHLEYGKQAGRMQKFIKTGHGQALSSTPAQVSLLHVVQHQGFPQRGAIPWGRRNG